MSSLISIAKEPSATEEFPLTDAQRELWLTALMDDRASRSYNSTFLIHLSGPLNETALQASLQGWLDRHDSLRAGFDAKSPIQKVFPHVPLPWTRTFLGEGVSPSENSQRFDEIVRQQSEALFDLTRPPLMRAQWVVRAKEEHVLILTVHHLVADGWSLRVLFSELSLEYAARVEGRIPSVETGAQLASYVSMTQTEDFKASVVKSENYWRQLYAELPATLELPADRTRKSPRSFGAARISVTWDARFVMKLRELSARNNATLQVTLLSGWSALSHRLSGQEDVVVGIQASGQISPSLAGTPGIQSLVGHCVQLLPLRCRPVASLSFEALIQSVRESMLDAFENQDVSFGRLLECLKVPREADRVPLASVMFNLDRVPGSFELSALRVRVEDVPHTTHVFDLALNIVDREQTLTLDCDFNTDLFDASTVERWMGHYRTLLESAVADSSQSLGRLELLTPAQRAQILVKWNSTRADLPVPETIHGLIAEQVRRSPKAIAVEFEDVCLTYEELDRKTDALASRLQSMGVGPDSLVGVFLQRSQNLVIAVLGVLKAGGAYVPLDPAFPRERLGWMVKDARLKVVVTEASLLSDLPPHSGECVCLDREELVAGNPKALARAEDMAYVIFTSGSTGRPKGVQVIHRGVVNFLNSMRKAPGMQAKDVLLAVTTLSFDIAVLELYLPLICGARVVITTREIASDGEKLIAEIQRRQITVLQATPTTWRLLLAAGWKGDKGMKLLCGGEAFPPDLATHLIPICGSLWNMYGPTETTVWSTCKPLQASEVAITIGRPIDNTSVYIVDRQFQPVPIGVPGELLIGGLGVSRGYLGIPELTSEKFIQDPFSTDPTSRVYRTGDLARWREDGEVVCLGRQDHQVKLRGYRIELGDIEAAISRQSGVGACAVIVREDEPGDKRVVAYLEAAGADPIDVSSVRSAIRAVLPDYMHPQHWVVLPRLPLTPNAKIDRRALPRPSLGAEPKDGESEPAVSATEHKLAEIWRKILGVDRVGRGSSFFDLGGHSLLTVRLFSEIERVWGFRLPLATILRAETLQALAQAIDAGSKPAGSWSSLVAMRAEGMRPPFFCAHGGGGEILFARDILKRLPQDQPFYGLQARGLQGDHARDTSIEGMSAHYVEEIRRIQSEGPYYLGGFCMGGVVAFEMARQLLAQGQKVALVVMIGTYNPVEAIRSTESVGFLDVWRQKLAFHWENWVALSSEDRWVYLKQRGQATVSGRFKRVMAWIAPMLRPLGYGSSGLVHGLLEDYNDKIALLYKPQPLDVDVMIIKPEKNFTFMSDLHMGWRDCVRGRLEMASAGANPGGMLVEPYVSKVGDAVATALTQSQAAQKGSPRNQSRFL